MTLFKFEFFSPKLAFGIYIKMSKHLEEINDRIIDLESFENRVYIITNLETSENETDGIRRRLMN